MHMKLHQIFAETAKLTKPLLFSCCEKNIRPPSLIIDYDEFNEMYCEICLMTNSFLHINQCEFVKENYFLQHRHIDLAVFRGESFIIFI